MVSKAAQLAYLGMLWHSTLARLAFWQSCVPLGLTQSLAQLVLGVLGVGGEEKKLSPGGSGLWDHPAQNSQLHWVPCVPDSCLWLG